MSDVWEWLEARSPRPPEDLRAALHLDRTSPPLIEALTDAGLRRLSEARARPGRVRESAFRLLEADALLTYACEAALESEDPQGALRHILVAVGS